MKGDVYLLKYANPNVKTEDVQSILVDNIYTNPTTDQVNIELDEYYPEVGIMLYDEGGVICEKRIYHHVKTIHLNMPNVSGVYQLIIKKNNYSKSHLVIRR